VGRVKSRLSWPLCFLWFREAGKMPRHAIQAEVARLSAILDLDLRATFRRA